MKQLKWIPVTERLPELHYIDGTWASSRSYPVYTINNGISAGYLNKYLEDEKARWMIGEYGAPTPVTHWIDTEGPNET